MPFTDYDTVERYLSQYREVDKIVTGGGAGVEQLALRFATSHGIEAEAIPPNIQRDGKAQAFKFRNLEIIEKVCRGVLLWNGSGDHYVDFIKACIQHGKRLDLCPIYDPIGQGTR